MLENYSNFSKVYPDGSIEHVAEDFSTNNPDEEMGMLLKEHNLDVIFTDLINSAINECHWSRDSWTGVEVLTCRDGAMAVMKDGIYNFRCEPTLKGFYMLADAMTEIGLCILFEDVCGGLAYLGLIEPPSFPSEKSTHTLELNGERGEYMRIAQKVIQNNGNHIGRAW